MCLTCRRPQASRPPRRLSRPLIPARSSPHPKQLLGLYPCFEYVDTATTLRRGSLYIVRYQASLWPRQRITWIRCKSGVIVGGFLPGCALRCAGLASHQCYSAASMAMVKIGPSRRKPNEVPSAFLSAIGRRDAGGTRDGQECDGAGGQNRTDDLLITSRFLAVFGHMQQGRATIYSKGLRHLPASYPATCHHSILVQSWYTTGT